MYFAYRPKKKLREFLVLRGEIPQESTVSSSLLVSATLLAKLVFISRFKEETWLSTS